MDDTRQSPNTLDAARKRRKRSEDSLPGQTPESAPADPVTEGETPIAHELVSPESPLDSVTDVADSPEQADSAEVKEQESEAGELSSAWEIPAVLAGETVTFTGKLASMTHEQAAKLIQEHGGNAVSHVSRHVTLLVVGEEGWPLEDDGKPSVKLLQAESLSAEGIGLRIICESDWLRMLGLDTDNPEVKRLYTPAMLSQLLKIPVHIIRTWERAGLIRAEKKVYRLPYFSYQEVTAARRVAELLQSGVTQQQLARSLATVSKFLPDSGRMLERLELLADHHRLVIRDRHGFFDPQTRQRYFDFQSIPGSTAASRPAEQQDKARDSAGITDDGEDEEHWEGRLLRFDPPGEAKKTATDWLVEGCRKAEIADTSAAIRCFRQALRIRPNDAEAHFYLADSLYRLGKHEAALERYLAAVENDAEYLEAWNQIGCVYAEMNRWQEALQAYDEALAILPEFAETHLQKAETLRMMRRIPEAVHHWKLYLQHDQRGPWAEMVHQRLEQAGVPSEE